MKRLARTCILLAGLAVIALFLSLFASVTQEDAAAKLHFVDPSGQVAQAQPAMDFIISQDGKNIQGPLCALPIKVNFTPLQRKLVFINLMGSYVPFLASLANVFQSGHAAASEGSTPAPVATLEWNAEVLQPATDTLDEITSEMLKADGRCAKEIEHALSSGKCVCRVATVYQSRSSHEVLAIQFQQECLTPDSASNAPKLAPVLDHPPFFTRLKRALGLIDMQYKA